MKKIFLVLFIIAITYRGFSQDLSVMTYNIKLDYPKEGENNWTNRKGFMLNQIKFYEPDVMGVQEAMPNQMADLDELLEDYNFVGVGRDDGKNQGEFSAIFYNNESIEVLESSTFWLSETPEIMGEGWDAAYNRICTYALLQHKKSKEKFWVFNTHFDNVGKKARKNSTALILSKIKSLNTGNHPVILTGDFNMEPQNDNIKLIKNNLIDSKTEAEVVFGPEGTYNGFNFNNPVNRRIDYVFVSSSINIKKYAVLSDNWDLKYPSDHFPVLIKATLNKK